MKRMFLTLVITSLAAACSSGGDKIIFDMKDGPASAALAKNLPGDLRGDTENVNHGIRATVGEGMKDGEDG